MTTLEAAQLSVLRGQGIIWPPGSIQLTHRGVLLGLEPVRLMGDVSTLACSAIDFLMTGFRVR